MAVNNEDTEWSSLSQEEKNRVLFFRQKHLLDLFLERRAISQTQHDKSLHDLIEKMGMTEQQDADGDGLSAYSPK